MGEKCGMDADEAVNICEEGNFPAGWDTFKQMYDSDGNHPSEQGTYLEGLIIASAMTGAPTQLRAAHVQLSSFACVKTFTLLTYVENGTAAQSLVNVGEHERCS